MAEPRDINGVAEIKADRIRPQLLPQDEHEAVDEGLAQAERGEFVPDAIVTAFFNKDRR